MRIHTNVITSSDIYAARKIASAGGHGAVYFQDVVTRHGSRSHADAWEVKLEGDGSHSRRRVNLGTAPRVWGAEIPYAATYDAWGWFLGHLFNLDPTLKAGPYNGAADFHARTGGKYLDLPQVATV